MKPPLPNIAPNMPPKAPNGIAPCECAQQDIGLQPQQQHGASETADDDGRHQTTQLADVGGAGVAHDVARGRAEVEQRQHRHDLGDGNGVGEHGTRDEGRAEARDAEDDIGDDERGAHQQPVARGRQGGDKRVEQGQRQR
jgi:hypothetical protein